MAFYRAVDAFEDIDVNQCLSCKGKFLSQSDDHNNQYPINFCPSCGVTLQEFTKRRIKYRLTPPVLNYNMNNGEITYAYHPHLVLETCQDINSLRSMDIFSKLINQPTRTPWHMISHCEAGSICSDYNTGEKTSAAVWIIRKFQELCKRTDYQHLRLRLFHKGFVNTIKET